MDEGHLPLLFLGMQGPFSRVALSALLAAGRPVVGVFLPAGEGQRAPLRRLEAEPSPSELRLLTPYAAADTVHLAWARAIPVFSVRHLDAPEIAQTVTALHPAVAGVACFPWRVPPSLLALPAHGFLNLHPSLLPAYRGPHPLFWTFRDGVRETGVTLHYMDENLDTGEIALQAPLTLPDGISGPEADQKAGQVGGALLVEATGRLAAGTLPRRPQPPGGRYYPRPTAADFHLDPTWSARRAFNFMRGTAEWGHPYILDTGGKSFHLEQALSYHPRRKLKTSWRQNSRDLWLQFTPGVLRARLR